MLTFRCFITFFFLFSIPYMDMCILSLRLTNHMKYSLYGTYIFKTDQMKKVFYALNYTILHIGSIIWVYHI